MNNVVTQRFIECVEYLKMQHKVKSQRQFALSLEYVPQGLSEMSNGRRDVTIELLRRAIEKYRINPAYVFTGQGAKILGDEDDDGLRILSVVTDSQNQECIVHVPVAAQAGYTDNLSDPEYFQELPAYSLPYDSFRSGSYRSFDVAGSSMEPTLQHGDKIVCSFIEPQYWKHAIKDGQVYVVITKTDVLVKRLINRLRSSQELDLVSDNAQYDIVTLQDTDIRELWWVRLKITPYLDKPSSSSTEIEQRLEHQSDMIDKLNEKITSLITNRVSA